MKMHHVRYRKARSGSRGTDAVSVRVHGTGNLGAKAIADILSSIKERRAEWHENIFNDRGCGARDESSILVPSG